MIEITVAVFLKVSNIHISAIENWSHWYYCVTCVVLAVKLNSRICIRVYYRQVVHQILRVWLSCEVYRTYRSRELPVLTWQVGVVGTIQTCTPWNVYPCGLSIITATSGKFLSILWTSSGHQCCTPMDKYENLARIGEGVFRCRNKESRAIVAVIKFGAAGNDAAMRGIRMLKVKCHS